jgi:hypothetical protein
VTLLSIIGALVLARWTFGAVVAAAAATIGRDNNVIRRMPLAYFWSADCRISAMSGGAPGQTISARLGEAVRHGSRRALPYARLVDRGAQLLGETNHCAQSDAAYRARVDAAPFVG